MQVRIWSILRRNALGVFVTLCSPRVNTNSNRNSSLPTALMQIQPPNSLWQLLWLVLHSTHNEHICLLAWKALILCNVTRCQLREGLFWKMPACCWHHWKLFMVDVKWRIIWQLIDYSRGGIFLYSLLVMLIEINSHNHRKWYNFNDAST